MTPFRWGIGTVVLLIAITTYAAEHNSLNKDVMYLERIKRSSKGYLRGQTQSQYLNFGKPEMEGKAEAAANESGSRSTVSGTHGMGQAQSQFSTGDCGECPGVSMYDYSLGPPDSLKLGKPGYQEKSTVGGLLQPTIDQTRQRVLDEKSEIRPTNLDDYKKITSMGGTGMGIQQPASFGTLPSRRYYDGGEKVQPTGMLPGYPTTTGDQFISRQKPQDSQTGLLPTSFLPAAPSPVTSIGIGRPATDQRGQAQPIVSIGQPSHTQPQIVAPASALHPYKTFTDQRIQAIGQPSVQPSQDVVGRQPLPHIYSKVSDQRPEAIGQTAMPARSFVQPIQFQAPAPQALPQAYDTMPSQYSQAQPSTPILQPSVSPPSQTVSQPSVQIYKADQAGPPSILFQPSRPGPTTLPMQPTTDVQHKPMYYTAPSFSGPYYDTSSPTWTTPQKTTVGYAPSYGPPGWSSLPSNASTSTAMYKNGKPITYSGGAPGYIQQPTIDQQKIVPFKVPITTHTQRVVDTLSQQDRDVPSTRTISQTQIEPQGQISIPLTGQPQTTITFGAQQGFGLQIGIGGAPSVGVQPSITTPAQTSTQPSIGIPQIVQQPGFEVRIHPGIGHGQQGTTQEIVIQPERPQGPGMQYGVAPSLSGTQQEIRAQPGVGKAEESALQYGVGLRLPAQGPGLQYGVGLSQPGTQQETRAQTGVPVSPGYGPQYGIEPSQAGGQQEVRAPPGRTILQGPGLQYHVPVTQPAMPHGVKTHTIDMSQTPGVESSLLQIPQGGFYAPQKPAVQYMVGPDQTGVPGEIRTQPIVSGPQRAGVQYVVQPVQPEVKQDVGVQQEISRPGLQYVTAPSQPGQGDMQGVGVQYGVTPSQPRAPQPLTWQPSIPRSQTGEFQLALQPSVGFQPGISVHTDRVPYARPEPSEKSQAGTTITSTFGQPIDQYSTRLQSGTPVSSYDQQVIPAYEQRPGATMQVQPGFGVSDQAKRMQQPTTPTIQQPRTVDLAGVPQQQIMPPSGIGAQQQMIPSGVGYTGSMSYAPGATGLVVPLTGRETDDAFSQAETSINNGQASASAEGRKNGGAAKTQVQGTYSSTGSFTASAMTSDSNRSASSQVTGNSEGAMSQAQGQGGSAQSQAQVQVNEKTGGTKASSQSGGIIHQSQSEVQANDKGGLADAQSSGPGQTSSQAQIGFRPGQDGNTVQSIGGGQASAQSGTHSGQSQSQIQGTSNFGVSYHGAAQSASGTKEQVASYREQNRNLFNVISQFGGADAVTDRVDTMYNPAYSGLTSEESDRIPDLQLKSSKAHNQAANNNKLDNDDVNIPYDEVDEEPYDEYDDDDYYNDSLVKINSKSITSTTTSKLNESNKASFSQSDTTNVDAKPLKKNTRTHNSINSGDNDVPNGFRGTINVEKKFHTKSLELHSTTTDSTSLVSSSLSPSSKNQVRESSPPPKKPLSPDSYVTVTKSITGSMNDPKNPTQDGKNFQSTFYTKSSTCGYFTFSCNIVYGANGRSKICRPKAPANGKC